MENRPLELHLEEKLRQNGKGESNGKVSLVRRIARRRNVT